MANKILKKNKRVYFSRKSEKSNYKHRAIILYEKENLSILYNILIQSRRMAANCQFEMFDIEEITIKSDLPFQSKCYCEK